MDRPALETVLAAVPSPEETSDAPFVSVYLPTPGDVPNAAQRLETLWRDTARELAGRGAPAETVEATRSGLGEPGPGNTRVIVSRGHRLLLAEWIDTSLSQPRVAVSPLPHLLPLLAHEAGRRPHVIVLADRTGADIRAVRSGPGESIDLTEQVEGTALEVRKVAPGGWSQLRYQHRAENGWEENAGVVAERIGQIAEQIGADVVVATGDERATTLIARRLPEQVKPRWSVVPGGRGRGSRDGVPAEVSEQVALAAARERTGVLERFSQERGQADQAVEGLGATLDALRLREVGTLLLTDELDPERAAWFGPDPSMLALNEREAVGLGAANPKQAPLVDVLVWSALAAGSDVLQLPKENTHAPRGGVGALLRYRAG